MCRITIFSFFFFFLLLACHSCDYHKYGDETEISNSAPPSDFTSAQSNIQSCISDTLSWMQSNKLKLNTEKTEMMLLGSPVRISSVGCESADTDGSCIPFQTTVTYLGVHLDQTLSVKQHISIASAALHFSHSGESPLSVRSSLTVPQKNSLRLWSRQGWTTTMLHFAGVADEQIARIQKIQNTAERLILKKIEAWSCHTAFERLHWLPVKYRIQCKLATLASSLWRHSSAIPVFFSLHISTIALPSFFDRKTAQNSTNKPENVRWTFFWLHCSDCLELAAGRPESFSLPPNFQS